MAESGNVVAGRYRLLEPVGQGPMGRMWRAYDQLLERVVAVQEVLPSLAGDDRQGAMRRLARESRAAAQLRHPNVAVFHDVVEHDGQPWLVMEFIPGRSLAAEIAGSERLPWWRVAEIGAQVADALAHAHALGLLHRHLNPGSIRVSGTRAVVTGFGVRQPWDAHSLTAAWQAGGTVEYMPPEELEGVGVGTPGDLWALGAILYSALEGRPPFGGVSLASLVRDILYLPAAPPEHAGPLSGLLEALLAKNPEERPDAKAVTRTLAVQAATSADVRRQSGDWPAASQQPSSASFTVNINQQIISRLEGNAVQNAGGTVNLGPRAEELLGIISKYGGPQTPELRAAAYEIEDQSASPEARRTAGNKLMEFLRQVGQGAQQIAVDVLEKYIEAKLGV